MPDVASWIKEHKTATAGIAAGVVLFYILLRRSGASSSAAGTTAPLQIAQLQAQQNLQMAQIQAQQNEASIGAQTQVEQTNAQLQGQQNQLAVETALSLNQTGTDAALAQEQLNAAVAEEQAHQQLVGELAPGILSSTNQAGHQALQATGVNELALLLGEGNNLGSYNTGIFGNANQSLASSNLTQEELFGLLGSGGGGSGLLASLGL